MFNLANSMKNVFDLLELEQDKQELREFGLTEEEIEGYEDMFLENYISVSAPGEQQSN